MNDAPLDLMLSRLDGARRSGTGWTARCPAHDDRNPSLSVRAGDDGRVLLKCHAGCNVADVAAALNLTMADLMPQQVNHLPPPKRVEKGQKGGRSTAGGAAYPTLRDAMNAAARKAGPAGEHWTYRNADGEPVLYVVRFERSEGGKVYRPIHPTPPGSPDGYRIGDPPDAGPLPLYRLPDLADAKRVYVCEGEKAAEATRSVGLTATTSAHGSKAADRSDWRPLAGREVVILPDHDEPGRRYARNVARELLRLDPATLVRIVHLADLPGGLPAKGDIADWLDERDAHDPDELRAEVEALAHATRPTTAADLLESVKTVCLADVESRPVEWLWPGRVPLGKLTMLAGDPGLGKSFLTMDIAARVSTGRGWPDAPPDAPDAQQPPGRVILLTAEDDLSDTIRPRLDAAGADVSRIHAIQATCEPGQSEGMFSLATDLDKLDRLLTLTPDARLVVIDPITAYLGGTDSHKNADVRGLLGPISEMAARHVAAFLIVNHLNKSAGGNAQYRMTGSLAFIAAARAGWMVSKDRDDPQRRLMLPAKMNVAPDASGLAYQLAESDTPSVAVVEWEPDPIRMTADEALAESGGGGKERIKRDEAGDWLRELLADGPIPVNTIMERAQEEGFSKKTVRRAKALARIEHKRDGYGPGKQVRWMLPHHTCPTDPILTHPPDVGKYDKGGQV